MSAYSKWTARVAVVTLGITMAVGIAVLPLNSADLRHPARVWPIPREFAAHHVLANVGMVAVWAAVGIGCIAVMVETMHRLLVRAGWTSDA